MIAGPLDRGLQTRHDGTDDRDRKVGARQIDGKHRTGSDPKDSFAHPDHLEAKSGID
jgi:hypothetical protein